VSNQTLPGRKSPRYGHLGLWVLSLGPNSPIPGDRLCRYLMLDGDGDGIDGLATYGDGDEPEDLPAGTGYMPDVPNETAVTGS